MELKCRCYMRNSYSIHVYKFDKSNALCYFQHPQLCSQWYTQLLTEPSNYFCVVEREHYYRSKWTEVSCTKFSSIVTQKFTMLHSVSMNWNRNQLDMIKISFSSQFIFLINSSVVVYETQFSKLWHLTVQIIVFK